ncbi:tRNA (adenosine(37)-N6)-dimethylallyltransferase MiaA [Sphingobium algorifonticola]|uniref:tRNA dimethylallyltransferase n=1 Tax=Sphingobium algorifonticola TaxID=2008318 RepID=A0A437J6T4_9SPHN|nr:tRNA (adenosine(37)-N6)-dimethylallyltransferase MiaA [Sphingobium algorifonticola]RVT40784.1 tRNA (adenosine(37)-N6)-dimethylallyltransferase MiaA [Sphingobium algorifonticola]
MDTSNPATGESRPPLALIAGPTASGKSALAIALAERTNGVVINCDASQVYADLAIISARPTPEDMARAPHRLFGHIDGTEACSAARWAAEARSEIAAAHTDGRLPILVGGTGLYIRTLLDGIAPVPEIDPAVRAEIRAMPVAQAHAALRIEDPDAALRLAPADTTRVARALEVARATGRTLADWQRHKVGGIGASVSLCALILQPPRDWLLDRCDRRFVGMLESGGVEEVRALVDRGLNPMLPVMRAIGVREIAAWDAGAIDRETMIAQGQLATRQYAKRQYTWFSNQPPPAWHRFHGAVDNKINGKLVRLFHK